MQIATEREGGEGGRERRRERERVTRTNNMQKNS